MDFYRQSIQLIDDKIPYYYYCKYHHHHHHQQQHVVVVTKILFFFHSSIFEINSVARPLLIFAVCAVNPRNTASSFHHSAKANPPA